MQELKCIKCGALNETFQRGPLITGTRCIACGYETLAKVCKDVGEAKVFLEKLPNLNHCDSQIFEVQTMN